MSSNHYENISAVILAGGQSRRMHGRDKAFIELHGQPLINRIIERLQSQVDHIVIATDPTNSDYQALGLTLLADSMTSNMGPLAGILTGLEQAKSPYVLTVPCDTPFLPATLVARLYDHMQETGARAVTVFDGTRLHGTLSLLDRELADNLHAYLENGGRQVRAWLKSIGSQPVDFSHENQAFVNINTEADLEFAESICRSMG